MNKQQKNYLIAKANFEAFKSQENELEQKYILDKKVVNKDGSIPKRIYCIDDEHIFDKANIDFCSQNEEFHAKMHKANDTLKKAENELVKFALDVIPANMGETKETLEKSAKTNYTTRLKIIDLVLKLDTQTISARRFQK